MLPLEAFQLKTINYYFLFSRIIFLTKLSGYFQVSGSGFAKNLSPD